MSETQHEAAGLLLGDQPLALIQDDEFLDTWGSHVSDDWNRLFGFSSPLTTPGPLWNQHGNIYPNVLDTVDVIWDNWDGAYWACYSRHRHLATELLGMIRVSAQMRVVPCSFRETFQIHKREWEVWQAENRVPHDV